MCVSDVLPNNLLATIPKSDKNLTISFFFQNQSEIRRRVGKMAKMRGYGEFGKKKISFNFCPVSEWMPPNCLKEHQEHTYMSKKNDQSPG